jgi:GR25 family glycosyltransferase involved in LPS biosynthesis
MDLTINLKDIKTYFINPLGKYQDRYNHMVKLIYDYDFKDIHHYRSKITKKYTQELKKVTINILSQNLNDEPILILEDDIGFYKKCKDCEKNEDIITMPNNCDAYYLGYHYWGAYNWNNIDERFCQANIHKINNNLYKINNMMGAHAIIYKSKRFKEKIIEEFNKDNQIPNDFILSKTITNYNVYGKHCPTFYQLLQFNTNNIDITKVTNLNLEEIKQRKIS